MTFGDNSHDNPEELLHIVDIPSFYDLTNNGSHLESVCCSLYGLGQECIDRIRSKTAIKPLVIRYEAVLHDGSTTSFYVKKSWEGAGLEVLGMALSNLLLDTDYRFLLERQPYKDDSKKGTIVMSEVPGSVFRVPEGLKGEISYNFGIALELAIALSLKDRKEENLIVGEDGSVANIDYGFLFSTSFDYGGVHLISDYDLVEEKVTEGRKRSKEIISDNFHKNKHLIKYLFDLADQQKVFDTGWNILSDPFNYMCDYLITSLNN